MAATHVVDVGEAIDATGVDATFGSLGENKPEVRTGGVFAQAPQLGTRGANGPLDKRPSQRTRR